MRVSRVLTLGFCLATAAAAAIVTAPALLARGQAVSEPKPAGSTVPENLSPQPAASAGPANLSPQPAGSAGPANLSSGPDASSMSTVMSRMSLNMSVDMERMQALALQSQLRTRQAILALLSPAQRSLVANTVGQLAIAPVPDTVAGARVIDATLSAAQRQAVVADVVDAFDRNQATFSQIATHLGSEMKAQGQSAPQSGALVGGPSVGEMDAARAQMHNALVSSLQNQSAGAIVIAILGSATAPGTGPFPAPVMKGPFPASVMVRPFPAPVVPK